MVKISALPSDASPTTTDSVPVYDVESGTTKRVSLANLATLLAGTIFPTGTIVPYGGAAAPTGFLLCYGQAISRTDYAALFTAISTTFGAGDASTTFNVPDVRGRVLAGQDDMGGVSANRLTGLTNGVDGDVLGGTGGEEAHTITTAQLPSHEHDPTLRFLTPDQNNGSAAANGPSSWSAQTAGVTTVTGGGGAMNVVQPTLITNYIIKT